ncbi:MAG: hypothetical protein R3B90_14950 [Planctomycetaceae bacterium]
MSRCSLRFAGVWSMLAGAVFAADSGPAVESAVGPFSAFVVTGEAQPGAVDYPATRGDRPTVYCFIPRDKWSRPAARLVRKLDGDAAGIEEARVVTVFLSDDVAGVKDYLPLCQQSLKLDRTVLAVFEANASGPPEWGLNTDVPLTIVTARHGKVTGNFAIESPNETLADEILKTLR